MGGTEEEGIGFFRSLKFFLILLLPQDANLLTEKCRGFLYIIS